MSVERREFNRRFAQDYEHAGLFNRALFEAQHLPEGPYWREARDEPVPEKLARKLEHFRRRGLLVAFDLEPFNAEDWTILHYGMGRSPARHDRFADQPPEGQVRQHLANMRREIETLVNAMPSHDEYMTNLRRYLIQERS
jgi:tryptophan halogenase